MAKRKVLKVHNKSDKPDNVVMKEHQINEDKDEQSLIDDLISSISKGMSCP